MLAQRDSINVLIKQCCFFSLLLVVVTLPLLSIRTNSISIIAALVFSTLHFIFVERRKIWQNNYFLMFVVLYGMHYLGFINSTNTAPVLFDIEQKLSFLVFPLIFVLGPALNQKQSKQIMLSFILTVCLACLLTFRKGYHLGDSHDVLYRGLLMHRPYLGMYCTSCILFCFYLFSIETKNIWRMGYLLIIVFLVFFQVLLIAKMSFLALFVLVPLYALMKLVNKKRFIVGTISVTFLLIILSYFAVVRYENKIAPKKDSIIGECTFGKYRSLFASSLGYRLIYWKCSEKILSKDYNWFIGVGTGDKQSALDHCYATVDSLPAFILEEHHDPHNQYLATWLSLGLLPLLFFLFHFFRLLYAYTRKGNWIAIVFTVGIMLFCITESIMKNQKGIVFYAIFQSLFIFGNIKEQRAN